MLHNHTHWCGRIRDDSYGVNELSDKIAALTIRWTLQ